MSNPANQDKIDSTDVIAYYAIGAVKLQNEVAILEEANKALELKVQELEKQFEKEKEASIPKAAIAKMVEGYLKTGEIPLPNLSLTRSKGLVSVSCQSEDISLFRNGIEAYVSFYGPNSQTSLSFLFALIPNTRNNKIGLYPGFHMGFTKPAVVSVKKQVKKAPLKTVEAKTTKDVSGGLPCTGNPS